MEIILFTKARGQRGRMGLGWACAVVVTLVLGTGSGAAYLGYRLATDQVSSQFLTAPVEIGATGLQWQWELADQRRAIKEASQSAEASLNALALRVGQLQAGVTRLEALGSRLARMAELPEGEFDFEVMPGLGGPEPESTLATEVPDFLEALQALSRQLEDRAEKLTALESLLMTRNLQAQIMPAGRPVRSGWVSSGFGMRADPVSGRREFHSGMDFAGRPGSDVLSVAAGVVTFADSRPGYGKLVEINHGNGYVTRYSHNRENLVSVGDKVDKGQVIALLGQTGRATGPHVHFEVIQDGKLVNPRKFIETIE